VESLNTSKSCSQLTPKIPV